ncbi:MAG: tetratricopeptide repeat protein [Deltaproteobacteria bacterium]|nr:tetratricopeptide repeat protein [Deltaproteobacteria bacterium]
MALNEYVLSLQIDSKQSLILKSLAENYFAIGRPDQALQILNRALHLNPENADLYLMRCEAKAQLGEWKDISADCKKIQNFKGDDPDYDFNFKGLCEYWI